MSYSYSWNSLAKTSRLQLWLIGHDMPDPGQSSAAVTPWTCQRTDRVLDRFADEWNRIQNIYILTYGKKYRQNMKGIWKCFDLVKSSSPDAVNNRNGSILVIHFVWRRTLKEFETLRYFFSCGSCVLFPLCEHLTVYLYFLFHWCSLVYCDKK